MVRQVPVSDPRINSGDLIAPVSEWKCTATGQAKAPWPTRWGRILDLPRRIRTRGETTELFLDAPHASSSWPAKAGHPRLRCQHKGKTWMPTCVGMTMWKRPLHHVEHLFPSES